MKLLKNLGNNSFYFSVFALLTLLAIPIAFSTIADSKPAWHRGQGRGNEVSETVERDRNSDRIPRRLVNRLRRDLARQTNIPPGKLRLLEASQERWTDSCLGLGQAHESCARTIVPGWRAVLSNGSEQWVYRTDSNGNSFRLETAMTPNNPSDDHDQTLPNSVKNAVLESASDEFNVPLPELKILKAESKTWPNGCLGIPDPLALCTQALVNGWRVVVGHENHRWVYRTNESGTVVKLEQNANHSEENNSIKPNRIPESELPAPLAEDVIFRAISSGGFAGETYQTVLREDGEIIEGRLNFDDTMTVIRNYSVSPKKVAEFQRLLRQQKFRRFDRLSYPAPRGAADFFTVTLTSSEGTIQYADLGVEQLPEELQNVIESWNSLKR